MEGMASSHVVYFTWVYMKLFQSKYLIDSLLADGSRPGSSAQEKLLLCDVTFFLNME